MTIRVDPNLPTRLDDRTLLFYGVAGAHFTFVLRDNSFQTNEVRVTEAPVQRTHTLSSTMQSPEAEAICREFAAAVKTFYDYAGWSSLADNNVNRHVRPTGERQQDRVASHRSLQQDGQAQADRRSASYAHR
jgi:hypothetical protein